MLRKIGTVCVMLTLAMLLIAVGCGKKKTGTSEDKSDTGSKSPYVSKSDEGTITGKVSFDGAAPASKKIDMSQDANCASSSGDKMTDDTQVADGKLANVFVYLKGGPIDSHSFPTPSDAVTLD